MLTVIPVLFQLGCNPVVERYNMSEEETQLITHSETDSIALHHDTKQRFIIVDSIHDPLPPEVERIQYFKDESGPQQLPKAILEDPIVLTRMPYVQEKGAQSSP